MVEKTAPGIALNRFQQLAKKYDMDLVPGTLIERDPKDGFVYNTAYYIDKSGKVLLSYRKVHLWHPERLYLTKGEDGFGTVKNRFGIVVGLCICWDIAFPETFRELAFKKNAQLVIAPGMCDKVRSMFLLFTIIVYSAYWCATDGGDIASNYDPLSEAKMLNAISVARCYENSIAFVFCNPSAEGEIEREQPFGKSAGRSQIAVPFKGAIAHADHDKEEMLIADVDIKQITDDSEEVYKVKKDYKEGLIYGGYANCGKFIK